MVLVYDTKFGIDCYAGIDNLRDGPDEEWDIRALSGADLTNWRWGLVMNE